MAKAECIADERYVLVRLKWTYPAPALCALDLVVSEGNRLRELFTQGRQWVRLHEGDPCVGVRAEVWLGDDYLLFAEGAGDLVLGENVRLEPVVPGSYIFDEARGIWNLLGSAALDINLPLNTTSPGKLTSRTSSLISEGTVARVRLVGAL